MNFSFTFPGAVDNKKKKKKKNIYGGKKKKGANDDGPQQDSDEEEEADMLESKEVDYMSESSSGKKITLFFTV